MVNTSRLSDKVAIVTGVSNGIGSGIATALAAAGGRLAVNYSSDREGANARTAGLPPRMRANDGAEVDHAPPSAPLDRLLHGENRPENVDL